MKHAQRVIITALCGGVAVIGAELYQARKIVGQLETEGVTVNLPLVGATRIAPSSSSGGSGGGGALITLPADVQAMRARMHYVAGAVGVVAMLLTFLVAAPGGSDGSDYEDEDDDVDDE